METEQSGSIWKAELGLYTELLIGWSDILKYRQTRYEHKRRENTRNDLHVHGRTLLKTQFVLEYGKLALDTGTYLTVTWFYPYPYIAPFKSNQISLFQSLLAKNLCSVQSSMSCCYYMSALTVTPSIHPWTCLFCWAVTFNNKHLELMGIGVC